MQGGHYLMDKGHTGVVPILQPVEDIPVKYKDGKYRFPLTKGVKQT
jgi:hypothetical protein